MEDDKNVFQTPRDLSATIHLLGDLLGRVITEEESLGVFETEERIRSASKARRAGDSATGEKLARLVSELKPETARSIASAFALYFDLINLAEENYRVRTMLEEEQKFTWYRFRDLSGKQSLLSRKAVFQRIRWNL